MSRNLNSDFTLKDFLFAGIKLAENADPDNYVYSGYSSGSDSRSEFSLLGGSRGKNVIIFEVYMSPLVHNNKVIVRAKCILICGKGPTKRLDVTTLTAEAPYLANF